MKIENRSSSPVTYANGKITIPGGSRALRFDRIANGTYAVRRAIGTVFEAAAGETLWFSFLFRINAYDRHWAQHILSLAFQALETGSAGTRTARTALRPWILADPGDATLKELVRTLGRTHAALRAQLHRLRKTWREAVRHAVAETVSHPDDVDDELRHLAAVLSRLPVE